MSFAESNECVWIRVLLVTMIISPIKVDCNNCKMGISKVKWHFRKPLDPTCLASFDRLSAPHRSPSRVTDGVDTGLNTTVWSPNTIRDRSNFEKSEAHTPRVGPFPPSHRHLHTTTRQPLQTPRHVNENCGSRREAWRKIQHNRLYQGRHRNTSLDLNLQRDQNGGG